MKFKDKLNDKYELTVNLSKLEIFEKLKKEIQNYQESDFLTKSFNFRQINILDNKIEITRKPKMVSPFNADGKIIIEIIDFGNRMSKLNIEIIPYSGNFQYIIMFVFIVLFLWTLGVLFTIRFPNSLFMILLSWIIFPLFLYLKYRYYK